MVVQASGENCVCKIHSAFLIFSADQLKMFLGLRVWWGLCSWPPRTPLLCSDLTLSGLERAQGKPLPLESSRSLCLSTRLVSGACCPKSTGLSLPFQLFSYSIYTWRQATECVLQNPFAAGRFRCSMNIIRWTCAIQDGYTGQLILPDHSLLCHLSLTKRDS